jgi:hypothetical protein
MNAIESHDEELWALLELEIDKAQASIRRLSASVSPVSREDLAKLILGFRKGLKREKRVGDAKSRARKSLK